MEIRPFIVLAGLEVGCRRWRDLRQSIEGRHHLAPSFMPRAVRAAVWALGITKPATCHTFRYSFATHLLEQGANIGTNQELLGHSDVKIAVVYSHVVNKGSSGVLSPACPC
jgi:site-specific recombinase XerD